MLGFSIDYDEKPTKKQIPKIKLLLFSKISKNEITLTFRNVGSGARGAQPPQILEVNPLNVSMMPTR